MLNKYFLTAAVFALCAMPAMAADECGATPIPPVVPTAADFGGKTTDAVHQLLLDTLKNIKVYQTTLQPYYDCLERQNKTNNDEVAKAKAKADDAKVATLNQILADTQVVYKKAVASEQDVAKQFNTLHEEYCKLGTGLKGCAAPK
jgi:hypothetical protein